MVQLITLFLWLVASPVWAATYYVATNGSNSNDGLTEATPKLTIAHTVSLMVAGDTAYVRGGTYNENSIRFARTGTQAAPIKLLNYPGEAPKIAFINPGAPTNSNNTRIDILHASGQNVAIGWITIEGFEITNGHDGIKFYSTHDSTFRNNWIHDVHFMGILGIGGTRNTFANNIISKNGNFTLCATPGEEWRCNQHHGLYLHGTDYHVLNNLIYGNLAYGITQNGSATSSYDPSKHPSTEYAGAQNWVIANNTFAYQDNRGGIVVWGGECDGTRIENNIFYENAVTQSSSTPQGIAWSGSSGSTGVTIRNNHFYASGSGGTVDVGTTASPPPDLVTSGNVTNVSPPAFVNGGSNSLPASPDFRLTASSPVNIARTNEFPNNSTNVVGAYKTLANPALAITANKITGVYPLNTAGPIQNLSTAGVTVACAGSACPGSPTVASVTKVAGTDSQFEIVVGGITGNACESINQNWTLSYNASAGSWTANDNIGVAPGKHQKLFSFTNLSVTNNCDGAGPPADPGTPYIKYDFDEGTGTTAINLGSLGASGNGTLQNGATWATGGGVVIAPDTNQRVLVPWGSGINPTVTTFTLAFDVEVPAGRETLTKSYAGVPLGSGQRGYIESVGGTIGIGVQTSPLTGVSSLELNVGRNHICLVSNSGTSTMTLYKNGVADTSTNGVKTFASFLFSGDLTLGVTNGLSNSVGGTFRNFVLYQSVQDCSALHQASQAPPANPAGSFSQTAVQFEDVYLPSTGGSPRVLASPNNTKKVIEGGAVAIVAQIECDDCDETAFRLESRDNGVGSWMQVPNAETAANTYMWGQGGQQFLNNGPLATRVLENGCTVVQGATQLTASQIPSLTLPASGCAILRYLIRVRSGASGYTEFRLTKEGGVAFTGTYVLGRIDIANQQAGGVGF